jgi:hypothetical protein
LGTLEVIHRVVHAEGIVFVNAIVYDYESVALLRCEWVLVAVVLAPKHAAQEVLLESRNEILKIP